MPNRDLVFVSYSHVDRAWREKLRVVLKPWMRRGLEYWADDYIQVGDRWEREIGGAIARARVGVLLVSAHYLASDFVWERELPPLCAAADQRELTLFCIPISASGYKATPLVSYQFAHPPGEPLDRLTEADCNAALVGIAEQIAAVLERMLAPPALFKPARREVSAVVVSSGGTPGTLHGVPEPPPHYLVREGELATLKRALLEDRSAVVGISGGDRRLGIQGLGGIGKSVLAQAVARDPEVRRAFPAGIHWISLGQTPEIARLQNELAAQLGIRDAGITQPLQGRDRLREVLDDKPCLLVLDDVWQREHAEAFNVLCPYGRALLTTRDAQLLSAVGAHAHNLDVLDPETSLRLLAEWTGTDASALNADARVVAEECGYLPLALALAAAQVKDGLALADVRKALEQGQLEFLDHPYGSVFKSLGASVRGLPEAEAARYRELAVVPEDTAVPASLVARLWARTAGLRDFEAAKLLVRFAAKGLLYLRGEGEAREVSFHDLQLDYLHLVEAENVARHHESLLEAASERLPRKDDGRVRWAALPASEQYLWQHLGHHLREAGRHDDLARLPRDVRWFEAKIAVSGVSELLLELARISGSVRDEAVSRIERALRLESGWLHRDATSLHGLLYNRLRSDGLEPDAIAALVPGLNPPIWLRHPVRLDGGERQVFRGHSEAVTACAYSPDGTRLLSASHDETLREWDARTGQELRCFNGHSDGVTACAYSPDGTRVLSASYDGTVREWDPKTGQELRRFDGHSRGVTVCAYSPDGTRVLSASGDKTVREWDARTGQELRRFDGHSDLVTACAYSPDGTRVLSASQDETLREWDGRTGQELRRFDGHSGWVTACAYSPDGTRVLSASFDKTFREWDRRTGQELRRFDGHSSVVAACTYSLDGTRALSVSWDQTVREWDVRTGQELRRFDGHSDMITACAYSPDGTRVVSASSDKTFREWDVRTGHELPRFDDHVGAVNGCAHSPDGTRVLLASRDGTFREWDARTGHELRRFDGHSSRVTACAYSPDGTRLLSASWDRSVREWDARTGQVLRRFESNSGEVTACAYSPDGTRVLSASKDRTVREWDARTGLELRRFDGHSSDVAACAYSPDGTRVLSASWDKTVREWDTRTGQELRRFDGHSGAVTACAYSPDGARVLSASLDQTIREWDTRTGQMLRGVSQASAVTACAYTPDGLQIVSASHGNEIRLWSAVTGACVSTVYGCAPFRGLAVRARLMAVGDAAGNLWLLEWDERLELLARQPARD